MTRQTYRDFTRDRRDPLTGRSVFPLSRTVHRPGDRIVTSTGVVVKGAG